MSSTPAVADQVVAGGEAVADRGHLGSQGGFVVQRKSQPLYQKICKEDGQSAMVEIFKLVNEGNKESSQGLSLGSKEHPFNFEMVSRFQTVNPYQGRCIHSKVAATVGLGFESEADRMRKAAKRQGLPEPEGITPEQEIARINTILDPLTRHSWQDLCNDFAEDYWQTGNGFIEVVREKPEDGAKILGLYHIPAREAFLVLEDARYNFHWEIRSANDSGGNRLFGRFGDLDRFLEAIGPEAVKFSFPGTFGSLVRDSDGNPLTSEVIHIRRPTSLSRWYGFPDWLSAVAPIELAQCLLQHNYDFFLNRGVPEFIMFLMGQRIDKATEEKITKVMQKATGLGNSHKSAIVGLPAGTEIQMERLALEGNNEANQFATMSDNLAMQITSAHGTPPLLAGIQIPGKLGAANELVQAMIMFQLLVVAPAQNLLMSTLRCTLGSEGAGLGLTVQDFVLNTLLDEIDLPSLDTVSRQRQDPVSAAAEGRTPGEGLRD